MLQRMRALATPSSTVALVLPQNWLFLGSYKKLREALLTQSSLALVALLGEHGFDSSAAAGAFTALVALTETSPDASTVFAGLDASGAAARPARS
jgi:type I restriction-modification system DNA methylase subunit